LDWIGIAKFLYLSVHHCNEVVLVSDLLVLLPDFKKLHSQTSPKISQKQPKLSKSSSQK